MLYNNFDVTIERIAEILIFLYLLPFYIAVGIYLLLRVYHWTFSFAKPLNAKRFKIPFSIIYIFCLISPVLAGWLPKNTITILIRRLSTYWMGVMLYMLLTVSIIDLLRLILKRTRLKNSMLFTSKGLVTIGCIAAVILGSVCTYGYYNARNIKHKTYGITVDKQCKGNENLKIALVADLHMGYSIGVKEIKQMVNKINALNADVVVIAGDIFDNRYESLDDPEEITRQLKSIKSKYGVFATYGNHDIEEQILMGFTFGSGKDKTNGKEMNQMLSNANITLLRDESILVNDSFYLVGRRDFQKPSTSDGSRLSPEELTENLDKTKPIIFVDHEPSELQEIADAGADIDLSGHTHDGQLFPGNIMVKFAWENPCGMIKKDSMYSIVTSGVGVYGPFMRVGTDSEICEINIHFNK